MASPKFLFTLALLCTIAIAIPYAAEGISCNQVEKCLAYCTTYLKEGGSVSSKCCSGVEALDKAASTTAARKQVCNCLKKLPKSISGINSSYAENLPDKCNVKVSYKISTSTNCNDVK